MKFEQPQGDRNFIFDTNTFHQQFRQLTKPCNVMIQKLEQQLKICIEKSQKELQKVEFDFSNNAISNKRKKNRKKQKKVESEDSDGFLDNVIAENQIEI